MPSNIARLLQALAVVSIGSLASPSTRALRRTSIPNATTLSVFRRGTAGTASRRRCRRGACLGRGWRRSTVGGKLALDKGNGLLAVLRAVSLVYIGVVAVAAVRIRRVTVRLDQAVIGAAALASWTSIESAGLAGANTVWNAIRVARITHEDGCLDVV